MESVNEYKFNEIVTPEEVGSVSFTETDFDKALKTLPKELSDIWQEKFEALDEVNADFLSEFQTFILARKKALNGSLELEKNLSPELIEGTMTTQELIRDTFGDSRFFLGNGAVAEVFEFPVGNSICVKYVSNQEMYNEGNHLRVEYSFLEELDDFIVDGIRTPKPYFLRIHPSEGHSYGMELIKGKSLSVILEKPDENLDLIDMVKKLDREKIKNSLLNYIKTIHEKFNITHGDLFLRNLMVDNEGNFYVIDFGKAKVQQIGEDHERRRETDVTRLDLEIKRFFTEIDNIVIK